MSHTSIDTEAYWTKPGWRGWVYGWKLHIVATAASNVWLLLVAEVTTANVANNEQAPALIETLSPELHFLLGDQHYHDEVLTQLSAKLLSGGHPLLEKTTHIHIMMTVSKSANPCIKHTRS
jgi:hypothetical protein